MNSPNIDNDEQVQFGIYATTYQYFIVSSYLTNLCLVIERLCNNVETIGYYSKILISFQKSKLVVLTTIVWTGPGLGVTKTPLLNFSVNKVPFGLFDCQI